MKREEKPWSDNFVREMLAHGKSILVRSTCSDCGKFAVADSIGNKIFVWEHSHLCENSKPRSRGSSAVRGNAGVSIHALGAGCDESIIDCDIAELLAAKARTSSLNSMERKAGMTAPQPWIRVTK